MYIERVDRGGAIMEQKHLETDSVIRSSYQWIIENLKEDVLERKLKSDIEKVLSDAHMDMSEQQKEQLRVLAFRLAEVGQETGFVRGVRYAFRFFTECL